MLSSLRHYFYRGGQKTDRAEHYDVTVKVTFDLLDIKRYHLVMLSCVKFCHNYHMNYWSLAKNMFCKVTVALTSDHQNLISSS